jgi:tungstate transport system substrate-binding protein
VQRLHPDRTDKRACKRSKDIVAALKTLKDEGIAFISRGDKSSTHQAELRWVSANGRGAQLSR